MISKGNLEDHRMFMAGDGRGQKIEMTGPEQAIGCGERPIFDTMCMTSERLRDTEMQLWQVHRSLFGSEPSDDSCGPKSEPSIHSEANESFDVSNRLIRIVQEIKNRLMS